MATIRAETAKDYAAIYEVNQKAFGGEVESRLIEALRKSSQFLSELSLVAEENQKIVGHILFSPAVIDTGKEKAPILALGPMAVIPEFQNQGVGSELVREGLTECKRLGYDVVVLVGHPHFYPRFGFTPARAKGLECTFEVGDEAFMITELVPEALEGMRGVVRYPAEFDGLE